MNAKNISKNDFGMHAKDKINSQLKSPNTAKILSIIKKELIT